jgi:polar amino acid transport system substrate-binding protein
MSAFSDEKTIRTMANDAGADGFLAKPVTPSSLLDTLMDVMYGYKREVYNTDLLQKGTANLLKNVSHARILVAEDNETNQEVARELLESIGFKVDVVEDGMQALDIILSSPFNYDAVLMDIHMPNMNGLESTIEIRKDDRFVDLPIIAMTAKVSEADKQEAFDAGMNDHIAKPIDPSMLFATLTRWISPDKSRTYSMAPVEVTEDKDIFENILEDFDLTGALARVGGKKKVYSNMLFKFAERQKGVIQRLEAAIDDNNIDEAIEIVHALKGVSGNIGATALYKETRRLVEELREDNSLETSHDLSKFKNAMTDTIEIIKQLKTHTDIEEPPQENFEQQGSVSLQSAHPYLLELGALLADFDSKSVAYFKTNFNKMNIGEFSKEMDQIEEAVSGYDFEKAMELLQPILARAETS